MENGKLQQEIGSALVGVAHPFATFDFDGTCVANDVTEATLAYACRDRLLKNKVLLGDDAGDLGTYHERVFQRYYELLKVDMLAAYLFTARTFAGFTIDEAETLVSAALDAEGEDIGNTELYGISIAHGLTARPVVRDLAKYLYEQGVAVWTVSASTEVAIRVAMRRFGYKGELIGLRNKVVDGILTDEIEEPYSIKEGKVACIKKYIDQTQPPMLAIGDSMNDAPMLEYSKVPVVVDRGNALATLARDRRWHLLSI